MINSTKRKYSSWEIGYKLPKVQSQWSPTDALNFSATGHDSMCKVLPIREAHINLGVHGFDWESLM